MLEEDAYTYFLELIHESEDKWNCLDVKEDGRGETFVLWERIPSEEENTFPTIKCEGILPCSAKGLYDFMLAADLKTRRKWDNSLVNCKVIREISPNNHLMHFIYSAPFPVQSRDFCVHRFLKEGNLPSSDKKSYSIWGISIEDDDLLPQSQYIRGDILISGYLIEEVTSNTCKITSVNKIDPKGWIPKFVINLTKLRPLQKLIKLSQLISKRNIS